MSLVDNMRVFVRVVELGSLTSAGRHLRVSPAVASHRIKELEKHVGVRLINRTTRALQPTDQGLIYYEGCLEVLRALEKAESAVADAGGRTRGAVKASVPLSIGRRIIGPAIPDFRALYPEIEVRLRLSDHQLDLMREGVDLSLRLGRIEDSSFTMRKIADCEQGIFASPAYLAREGAPRCPDDLSAHQCLLLRYPGSTQYQWSFAKDGTRARAPVRGAMDADDADILLAWTLGGHGLARRPVFEVAEHLRSGALVPVLKDWQCESATLALLYPHRQLLAPRVKIFAEFLIERCQSALRQALRDVDGASAG